MSEQEGMSEDELRRLIAECDALMLMFASDGWMVFEASVERDLEGLDSIVQATSWDQVCELKGAVKALNNIHGLPAMTDQVRENLQEQLDALRSGELE